MSEDGTILRFDAVATEPQAWYDVALHDVSFALSPGELGLMRFDRHAPRLPLADAATGIAELSAGTVWFLGRDWQDLRPGQSSACRGKIGQFFGHSSWVNHLDVDENVTLSERHHTHRPLREIEDEVMALCQAMGLPDGLPSARPVAVEPLLLQRSACVRMLLGEPKLLIMDEPAAGLFPGIRELLIPAIASARARGAAVVWLTSQRGDADIAAIDPTFRGRLVDGRLNLEV